MLKKVFMIFLCLILMLMPVSVLAEGDDTASSADEATIEDINVDFAVFFTADMNGVMKNDNSHIGFAKLKGLMDMQSEDVNMLMLDAGNTLGDEDPEKVIKLMKAVGYDAAGIGVKDAALGKERLQELAAKADFPLLCANWLRGDGELYYEPYTIVEIDGLTVGIIGLISPDILEMYPEETENDNVYNPVPIANIYYEEMLEKGCNCFIALTSLGFESDYTPLFLGTNCPWINLILDSNTAEGDILDNGTVVNGTNTCVFNLTPDSGSMSVIEVVAGYLGFKALTPSTMTAADFGEIAASETIEEVINTDYTPVDENAEPTEAKTRKSMPAAQKFILLVVCITAVTVGIIVLAYKKKEKKKQ